MRSCPICEEHLLADETWEIIDHGLVADVDDESDEYVYVHAPCAGEEGQR